MSDRSDNPEPKRLPRRGGYRGHVRRPWPGPPKQSAFVFLFHGKKLYAVKNDMGELGAPGGKRDDEDKSIFVAAQREFKEETPQALPFGRYSHFEWGNSYHTIRIFHRQLSDAEASALAVGETKDADDSAGAGKEVEVLWDDWDSTPRAAYRPHIAQALDIYKALTATQER